MSDPPRRRRSTPPPRRPSSGSSLLPTIALGIGVIVAGLGIGAFLSAVQNKSTTTTTSTVPASVPQVTPVARATRGPVAIATLVAHPTPTATPKPSPAPSATATPRPTSTPHATPSAAPTATATASSTTTARPAETATPRPTSTPRPTAAPHATPAPAVVTPRPATPRPTAVPTPRPTPVATPRPTAAPATPLTSGGVAQNTVRRYLADLIAGNENAAYAELGKNPGDGGGLAETAFIDRGTRITSIRTTGSDANGATVEVELTSSRGKYFATYHVTNGSNGAIIDQHDYIKV